MLADGETAEHQLAQLGRARQIAVQPPHAFDAGERTGLERTLEGLATTRSHFRALQALAADAGVALPKIGYTRELLAAQVGDRLELATVGELRWDRIEDRLMGLVPHEFKALVCTKPGGN